MNARQWRMDDRPALHRGGINLLVLVAYAGVAVATTWPLVARLSTHLPGGTTDTLVHYWNGWWVGRALSTGQTPFYTSLLFHPAGISLTTHNFAWLNIGAWLALRPWVGGFAAYNLALLANLAACGFAAFLLARDLTGDRGAAFLAGLIYQCWPFRLAQLDHPNLISTQWIPLFMLFLIRTVRRGRWQDGVLAGTFLALTGYTRWQLLIPAAILGGIYLVCALPARWAPRPRQGLALLLAGGVAALALAPPMLLMAGQWGTAPANLLVEGEEITMQTDLLAYLTPNGSHPVLADLTQPAYERYYADRSQGRRFPAYVGFAALALALLGVWRARWTALPWLGTALVLVSLALGPVLRVNGQLYTAAPMPYRLWGRVFVVRLLRFPDRFNMFLALPVAVLAAYGVASVLARARRRGGRACPERGRRATAIACALGGAILFEYLAMPVPMQDTQLSPYYAQLASQPDDFAVLNLPIDPQQAKLYMFAQVIHGHPILQGKTARFPEGTYAYLDTHPWLWGLRQSGEMSPEITDVGRQLASLAQDGVRYVILHKELIDVDRLARWQRTLLSRPRFEDEQIAVYATSPLAGRDFELADELAPGIGPIRVLTSTGCLNPGRVLEVDVGWGATATPGQDFDVRLTLVEEAGSGYQEEVFPLSQAWPTGEWPANAMAWGYYVLHAHPSLPAGEYAVALALADPETGESQGQQAVVGRVTVSPSPCEFSLPMETTDAVRVNALFGDDLRLLGYRLDHAADHLTVTLYWRAERRMETAYKIFIHVFDPATSAPAAQDDAMPRRWAYPTQLWSPGQVVTDAIPISLEGVPAGAYTVAVGVYDPATTERLAVIDRAGELQPDGRLVLPGETINVERGP
jgi:hypothetical protein